MPKPEEWISQTDQKKVAVPGRLVGGGSCTTQAIRVSGGFVIHPYGLDGKGVRIATADAATLGAFLLNPDGTP